MKATRLMSLIGIILGGLFTFLNITWVMISETDYELGIAFWGLLIASYLLAQSIVIKIQSNK